MAAIKTKKSHISSISKATEMCSMSFMMFGELENPFLTFVCCFDARKIGENSFFEDKTVHKYDNKALSFTVDI